MKGCKIWVYDGQICVFIMQHLLWHRFTVFCGLSDTINEKQGITRIYYDTPHPLREKNSGKKSLLCTLYLKKFHYHWWNIHWITLVIIIKIKSWGSSFFNRINIMVIVISSKNVGNCNLPHIICSRIPSQC